MSFESYSYTGSSFDNFTSGVNINIGDAYYLSDGTPVASALQFAGLTTPVRGVLSSIENVWGSSGNDIIVGSVVDNELHGGEGNDKIFGVGGNDLLYGEGGNDVMVGGTGNTSFNGGGGNDYMRSALGNDWIEGGDPTSAGAGRAKTFRSSPDSTLAGGGLSMLNYGDSVDYSYLPQGWKVTLTLSGDIWVDATVYDDKGRVRERDKVKSVENIVGGAGSDPLVGDGNGNVLDGGQGDDTIDAGAGDDLLIGTGGGNDDINGGTGDDEIAFVPVIDPVNEAPKYSPANNKLNDNKSLVLDLRLDGDRGRYSYNTVETSAASNQPLGNLGFTTANAYDDPWRGTMVSIENVVGTEKNDQIAGNSGANTLNGYDGDDIVYGAGGNDTLVGGTGNDWALFRDATPGNKPVTTNSLNVDPVVFEYNAADPYAAGGTIRLGTSYTVAGFTGSITSIENVLGSVGNDKIVGDALDNILAGEAGRDMIYGAGGTDRIYGGAVSGGGYTGAKVNSLWGGAGGDTFLVGFNYNPVVGTARVVKIGANAPVENTYGALPTDNTRTDYGIVRLDGKTGTTSLDYHDVIEDWQTSDGLFLAKDWTAVVTGLGASNGTGYSARFDTGAGQSNTGYDWSGNDTVDLRSINGTTGNNENKAGDFGKVVAVTGAGDDNIHGSNGNDWVFAGSGFNTIDLGSGENDGADIVFIDTFLGSYNVTGFDGDDKVYIHRSVIDALSPASLNTRALTSISQPGDGAVGANITTGTAYRDEGHINPLSPLLFDAVYSSILGSFPGYNPDEQPIALTLPSPIGTLFSEPLWTQNGASTNQAHYYSEEIADAALYAAAAIQIAYGTGLLPLPIIGTIIGGVLIASGGTMIEDGKRDWQHRNTTYQDDSNALGGLFSFMASQNPASSASNVGSWEPKNFLDFYNIPVDRFMPTLEVTTHPVKEGIYTIASVFNGTESFIYLIFSPDCMIQNSETRLIAQINGQVAASQVVLYDDTFTDITRYSAAPTEQPVFAPEIKAIAVAEDANEIAPAADALATRDKTPTVTLTLAKTLVEGDTVSVTFGGQTVDSSAITVDGTTVTVQLPQQNVDGDIVLVASVVNTQGFTSTFMSVVTVDTTAPVVDAYGITASAGSIAVSTNEAGTFRLIDSNGSYVTLAPQGEDKAADANGYFTLNSSNSITVTPAAQGSKVWIDKYEFTDALGNMRTISAGDTLGSGESTSIAPAIALGTTGDDSFDASSYSNAILFGFGGNDTLTLGTGTKTVVFSATAASNGTDIILGFTTGASGDVLDFSGFLPGGTFSADDHVVGNPAGATAGNGPLNVTNKVVQVFSDAMNSSVNDASGMLGLFNTVGTNGTLLTINAGGKAVILFGEDTVGTLDGYVWFVNDANSDGVVSQSELSLVGAINDIQLGTLVASNIIA